MFLNLIALRKQSEVPSALKKFFNQDRTREETQNMAKKLKPLGCRRTFKEATKIIECAARGRTISFDRIHPACERFFFILCDTQRAPEKPVMNALRAVDGICILST